LLRRRSIVALALVAGCHTSPPPDCARVPADAGCTRVLFIGNSYTFANVLAAALFHDMPRGLSARGSAPEGQAGRLQQAAVRAAKLSASSGR